MTEKIYRGIPGDNAEIWVIPAAGQPYLLKHVVFHSPTGFSWGYGGSGPADLPLKAGDDIALSILADHLDEHPTEDDLYHGRPRCWQLHQPFTPNGVLRKWSTSTAFPLTPLLSLPFGEACELHSTQIQSWLTEQAPHKPQPADSWLEAAFEDRNGCGLEDY